MKQFDTIKIGDKAELSHNITQKDIDQFVSLTGDDNRLHVDQAFADRTPLKHPVAHGMLGASFISTVIGTKLPGDGALWCAQSLEFRLPVRVGDTITVIAEVVKKIPRLQAIEVKTDIFNQNRQLVTSGIATIKMVAQTKTAPKARRMPKDVALVLGGTGGIGQATCIQLAKDGFDIAIHYHRNKALAEKTKTIVEREGRRAIVVPGDLSDPAQMATIVSLTIRRLSTISVAVNCATLRIPRIKIGDMEWDDIHRHIDADVKVAFHLQKNLVPIMSRQKYGKIIFLTTQAIEKPTTEWAHYITGKAALHGFAKALALELAPSGICVNLVSPGMTNTGLIADLPEKTRLLAETQTPLLRIADPKDVAGAISYLASNRSNFLVGETIRLNGGQVMI